MRVCLIALSSPELAVPAEIGEVANTLSEAGHTIYMADASRRGLLDALRAGPHDLVWFAGHSGDQGFELADGVWHPFACGRWLDGVQASMFVANSCFSAEHVVAIQRSTDVDVVATIAPDGVDDQMALETAIMLARAFVASNDLAEATRRASANGQLQYRFFPCGDAMAQSARAGDQAQDDMAALIRAMKGDPFSGSPGLIQTVQVLAANVATLTARIESNQERTDARLSALEEQRRYEQQMTLTPRVFWLSLMAALAVASIVVLVLVRLGGV